jgi:hypothetical protein
VDFVSARGVRFLAPPGAPAWRAAAAGASARVLDIFVHSEFEARCCALACAAT